MKVLWLTFIPSPYRLSFFEELSKYCDLTVLFERESSKIRKGRWNDFKFDGYRAEILKGITIGGYDRFCLVVKKYILDAMYDIIVISNPTSPTGIYAAKILKAHNIPYIVESDGAFPTKKKGLKMRLKKYVMSSARFCFSTAKLHDEYYFECSVKNENIRRYPFTSLYMNDIEKIYKGDEKTRVRIKLGIVEEKVILAVGQFVYRKGFDVLLKAMKDFPLNVGIYFIGDEPTEEYQKLKNELALLNVHFCGFKNKEELKEYYRCADLFVLPTREDIWGLVINEAMACGLPIISTDKCIAALELVEEGKNGYIVPVDDVEGIRDRINRVLSMADEDKAKMGTRSLEIISSYTFENMAKVHMQVFEEVLREKHGNMGTV